MKPNWTKYSIRDILDLEYGKSLSDYRIESGNYDVYGTNGRIGFTNRFLYDEPSIIIGRKGAYREVHFAKRPFFAIDTAFYTKSKTRETDTTFLYYWFKNTDINAMDSGSAIPSTSRDEVYDLEISLPPLIEQKGIAEVLNSLDDKIDLLHRQNKTLELLAETVFREWFVQGVRKGWMEGKLDDVVSVKGGTTPSTKTPEFWDGDIHWSSPRDLSNHNYVFLFDTERRITETGLKEIGSGLLPIGTVLLSSRAPIGYLAITEIPLAINQGYIGILCDKTVSNYFMYLWCKANMQDIENAGNGSVFQEISKSSFKDLDITIPPTERLAEFDGRVEPIFQKVKINAIQIRTLSKLRDTLLPKLMSGEVKVGTTE